MKKIAGIGLLAALLLLVLVGCTERLTETPTSSPIPSTTFTPLALATATLTPNPPRATFPPAPSPSPTENPQVRFAVIGDFGSAGPDLAAVADLIDSWEVDLILTTGDNNYPLGSPFTIDENIGQYFHNYIFPYQGAYGDGAQKNRFFPSMGNHDWIWLDGKPYLDYFELPGNERYYAFTWDFIDFFILSSDWEEPDGITANSIQGEWLQAELADSTAEWQVVIFHHAPYSSGYHGPTKHMQWPFADWGVDVVLSGHDHHYERLEVDGLLYFVQGLSGGAIYALYQTYPGSQARYNSSYGALLAEATPDQLWFGFYNIDGDLVDEYALTR